VKYVLIAISFFVVFESAKANPSDVLNSIKEQEVRLIANDPTTQIAPEFLNKMWGEIQKGMPYQGHNFEFMMHNTWNHLRSKNKILKLTQELRNRLGLTRKICGETCYRLSGYYLPLANFILVDFDENNPDPNTIYWFYHELVHAVQYTYRLPLDLGMAYSFTKHGDEDTHLEENLMTDFLSYYYETQAHWYTLRFAQPTEWSDKKSSAFLRNSKTWLSAAVVLGGMLLPAIIGHEFAWEYIPQTECFSGPFLVQKTDPQYLFSLKELPVDFKGHWFNPAVNIDMGFYEDYADVIKQAYLGNKQKFTESDQYLFVKIHNNWAKKMLRPCGVDDETQKQIAACLTALNAPIVNTESPTLSWFGLNANTLSSCPQYANSSFWKDKDEILNLYSQSRSGQFFNGGGRGAGGPLLQVQPQVILTPDMVK
jgi:hypothetical protein